MENKFIPPLGSIDPVATITDPKSGLRAWIYPDLEPGSPDEWDDNPVLITYRKGSRYTLGNKAVSEGEEQELLDQAVAKIPVYAYIHSGVSLSASPFGCRWDSGQSGWAILTPKAAKTWHGDNLPSQDRLDEHLKSVIREWDTYFQGDVYGVIVTEQGSDEQLASCWNLHTTDYAIQEATEMLADEVANRPQLSLFDSRPDPSNFIIEHL